MRDMIAGFIIDLLERGAIPDSLARQMMRRLCAQRAASLNQHAESGRRRLQQFLEKLRAAPIAPLPEKANEQHYELPPEFFQLMLGPRKKYSCCLWSEEADSLAAAEDAALRVTCQHAELEDGMSVLDLGCGWGSLSLWILEHYPRCQVTAVSNSRSQRLFIESEAERLGAAGRLHAITADMNRFQTPARFDRVLSIEMFEHMRNYERLFHSIAGWLRPGGKLFAHVFCHRQVPYEFEARGPTNWMARYFFTGGLMPSRDLFSHFPADLRIAQQLTWNGSNYAKTVGAWLANLDARREQVMPILRTVYGAEARRWFQRWRMFLLAGMEFFGYRGGEEWFVEHYLLEPNRQATNGTSSSASFADASAAHAKH